MNYLTSAKDSVCNGFSGLYNSLPTGSSVLATGGSVVSRVMSVGWAILSNKYAQVTFFAGLTAGSFYATKLSYDEYYKKNVKVAKFDVAEILAKDAVTKTITEKDEEGNDVTKTVISEEAVLGSPGIKKGEIHDKRKWIEGAKAIYKPALATIALLGVTIAIAII